MNIKTIMYTVSVEGGKDMDLARSVAVGYIRHTLMKVVEGVKFS